MELILWVSVRLQVGPMFFYYISNEKKPVTFSHSLTPDALLPEKETPQPIFHLKLGF